MVDAVIAFSGIVAWALKIYSWMHIAAFLLSWVNADPYNPIVSFINRTTRPLWDWVGARVSPSLVPFAAYLALMLVLFAEISLPGIIRSAGITLGGHAPLESGVLNGFYYLILGALSISKSIIGFIFLLAIIWFILTLVNPPLNNPIVQTIMYLVDPLITPLQRVLPRAQIDLSPLILAGVTYFISELLGRLMYPLQAQLII
ncbi:MAG: YggT family protein [SAR324 cluster bacterium]|uniref:YggT family protein n=1 Tax=SAR324 cluster bacterium TaxID=2024889 RepID=A0A2A4SP26_9DELT|nr:MAG: YggT family protein [SAR324 cluster bacterium]